MKRFYLTINAILLLSAALLLLWHFNFKPSPPDKALKRTPLPTNDEGKKTVTELTMTLPSATDIHEKNIFDPSRGKEPEESDKNVAVQQNRPQLELIGICRMGEISGAIIVEKGARQAGGNSDRKNIKKRYFKQGEDVHSGFCLNTIDVDRVVLKRGHDMMELKIGRERSAGQAVANRQATSPPIISSQQEATQAPPLHPPVLAPAVAYNNASRLSTPPPPQNVRK